jgi:hypothetical protein
LQAKGLLINGWLHIATKLLDYIKHPVSNPIP